MTGEAEGPVGPRRASGGEVLLLVAALVLMPRLFVIAPLAGLLAAARPHSGRARGFTLLAFVLVAVGVATTSGLLDRVVTAWAVLTAGAFTIIAWRSVLPSLFPRAVTAVAVGAVATLVLMGMQGVSWAGLERYAARDLAAAFTAMLQSTGGDRAAEQTLTPLQQQVPVLAALLPAQLALGQLLGLTLAWRWHEWTAEVPLGPPAGRFADFWFSEWWIVVVIVPLAALLFGAEDGLWSLAANALLLAGGLYMVRGAAVLRARLPPIGPIAAILYGIAAAVLAVFVMGALTALGLADNFYDLRRTAPDSSSRNQAPWK